MTRWRFEFEDSEVAGIESNGNQLRVRFSAASVTRSEAGGRPEPGYLGGLELRCERAVWDGATRDAVGRLAGGFIDDADDRRRTRFDLPLELRGSGSPDGSSLHCELRFRQGQVLRVTAAAFAVTLPDDARYGESFAC